MYASWYASSDFCACTFLFSFLFAFSCTYKPYIYPKFWPLCFSFLNETRKYLWPSFLPFFIFEISLTPKKSYPNVTRYKMSYLFDIMPRSLCWKMGIRLFKFLKGNFKNEHASAHLKILVTSLCIPVWHKFLLMFAISSIVYDTCVF